MSEDVVVHAEVVERVVGALRELPFVVAIGAYGSTATRTWTAHSDVDLVAVTAIDPPVESLRFFVDGVAVDLNLRACASGPYGLADAEFVPECSPLWDPDGVFSSARVTGRIHDSRATDASRYMLFHDAQKLRQIDDVTLRRLAMGQFVERVMRAWYQTRDEPFPGEVASVYDLRQRAPSLVSVLDLAITEGSVDHAVAAAEEAAAPAGGVFGPGQILACSWARPAVEPVPDLFRPFVDAVADLATTERT